MTWVHCHPRRRDVIEVLRRTTGESTVICSSEGLSRL